MLPSAYKLILIEISDYPAWFGFNPLEQRNLILYLKYMQLLDIHTITSGEARGQT